MDSQSEARIRATWSLSANQRPWIQIQNGGRGETDSGLHQPILSSQTFFWHWLSATQGVFSVFGEEKLNEVKNADKRRFGRKKHIFLNVRSLLKSLYFYYNSISFLAYSSLVTQHSFLLNSAHFRRRKNTGNRVLLISPAVSLYILMFKEQKRRFWRILTYDL